MRYMGGKFHTAKWICPILQGLMTEFRCRTFVDLFCGACNIVGNMPATGRRIANDAHADLIALWQAVQTGYTPPPTLSAGQHARLKATRGQKPTPLRAFAGFGCSYRGKYFGGYSGPEEVKTSRRAIIKKRPGLIDVEFHNQDYRAVPVPAGSLLYCDIPYQGTTSYGTRFDHAAFWAWATEQSRRFPIVVSEYERNVRDRQVIATRRSSCWLSDKHVIPTTEALVLLSPRDHE